MKVAVIGAGPAGLTCAYELSKNMHKIEQLDVYESSNSVGGLAKSIELWGQIVDIGPHRFFSDDTKVNKLWLEVIKNDYDMVDRLTRIYYNKKFFFYPLKPFNAFFNLGPIQSFNCFISYINEKIFPTKNIDTFETWVRSRFGKKLYQIFFKTYSEKLWGISCNDLDSDFASQRIKKLSLFEAVKNALIGNKNNKHKTLVDQFAYPYQGTGMVYENMSKIIQEKGGKIYLNSKVKKVIVENNKATGIELENGELKKYDRIVSSMPISHLVSRIDNVPNDIKELSDSLKFRNTILVYLNIKETNVFKDQWLYIHSKDVQTGRITNFRNWLPSLNKTKKETILCLEYWCNFEDELWSISENELIEIAKKEIITIGLVDSINKIKDGKVIKLPRCYPIYFKGYKKILKPVENYLSTIKNLWAIGRYGSYKYNNQDHSILMGLLASENILYNKNNNLWEVNTDYENYQESSVITKSGLVTKN
ncbi:MAG: FAD-dependent oxidoreductase [Candidatus Sericytochromatia bacterium]